MGFPGGASGKKSGCNGGDLKDEGSIPDIWLGGTPGGGNGTPLRILAWRIPQTEEPGRLQSANSWTQLSV